MQTSTGPRLAMNPQIDADTTLSVPGHPLTFEQVRIENTAHCGYKCFFCPRESLTRPLGFMPLSDFELVLERVGTHAGRVDLHGFGEPLLDAQLPAKVAVLKERWAEAIPTIYSTLGCAIPASRLSALVGAGLAHIEVSFYGADERSYELAHGVDRFELAKKNLELLVRARARMGSKLRIVVRRFPEHEHIKQPGASEEVVRAHYEWMMSLGVEFIRERPLHNYGSGRAYNRAGTLDACSVIWGLRYRILQVTWDLHVIPCCFDFDASVPLGNLREQSLQEIFCSEEYRKFYLAHASNELSNYPVCVRCERCREP
nr:SPASM domain-containing protein [uncultured Steroidobacter sp.]